MNDLDARIERERTRADLADLEANHPGLSLTDRDIARWSAVDARTRLAELLALKEAQS